MAALIGAAATLFGAQPVSAQFVCAPGGPGQICTNTGTASVGGGDASINQLLVPGVPANITNSGTASASGGDNSINQTINGTGPSQLINSGTISVAGGDSSINQAVTMSGSVINSGLIMGAGGSNSLVQLAIVTNGSVVNSGTMSGTVGDGSVINAIVVTGLGSITNTGTVSVVGSPTNGVNAAIIIDGTGTIVNSGQVSVFGTNAAGLGISGTGTIINSGLVTVVGDPAAGVGLGTNSTLINSGTISASGGALAIIFGSGGTLSILPGSQIIGGIDPGPSTTVNFNGGNHNLTLASGAAAAGPAPFVVSGNQMASFDPTPFAMEGVTLLDFSRAAFSAIPALDPAGGPPAGANASATVAAAFASAEGGMGPVDLPAAMSAYAANAIPLKAPTMVHADGTAVWARAFGGVRRHGGEGTLLLPTDSHFYGGMIGADWRTHPGWRVGVYVGGGQARSVVDLGYGENNTDIGFAGMYARYNWNTLFVNLGVQAGVLRTGTTRNINNNIVASGRETATARYDGWYVSPEVTLGTRQILGVADGAVYSATQSLKLRYFHASFDGYTETGSTANLTVAGRSTQDFEERLELNVMRTQMLSPNQMFATNVYVGGLGVQRVGDATVGATLLGQEIAFATPGADTVWGGFGGAGIEYRSGNVSAFASGEYLTLLDRSDVISGRAGVRATF